MAKLRQTFNFVCIFVVIFGFLAVTSVVSPFIRYKWKRTFWLSRILKLTARASCWALDVRVTPIARENFEAAKNALLVGNHVSYVDVVVIASQLETCFVTSTEIKETPFLGHICRLAGCLFVERRSRKNLTKEIEELTEGLRHGLSVTIFPEATSTNGEQILRFRRPLFLSAQQSGRPVIPVCINYRKIGTENLSLETRDKVFWYGDMPFAPHLWTMAGLRNISAELTFLPAISAPPDQDPGEIAARAQMAVESVFSPVKA